MRGSQYCCVCSHRARYCAGSKWTSVKHLWPGFTWKPWEFLLNLSWGKWVNTQCWQILLEKTTHTALLLGQFLHGREHSLHNTLQKLPGDNLDDDKKGGIQSWWKVVLWGHLQESGKQRLFSWLLASKRKCFQIRRSTPALRWCTAETISGCARRGKLCPFPAGDHVHWCVSRYGLPVNFQAMLLQPNKKSVKRLRDVLNVVFKHLDEVAAASIMDVCIWLWLHVL